ncbi:Hypothetical_protein [Hexamita inflata]|uniref:Hypothetical_protein n=1 Tax=Hexamita inflata TaxID=28002 RepID=A0AA86NUX1_9EUKA|nr:Hypothetical protein HINF_LOCUS13924 [Hexamita inflata]
MIFILNIQTALTQEISTPNYLSVDSCPFGERVFLENCVCDCSLNSLYSYIYQNARSGSSQVFLPLQNRPIYRSKVNIYSSVIQFSSITVLNQNVQNCKVSVTNDALNNGGTIFSTQKQFNFVQIEFGAQNINQCNQLITSQIDIKIFQMQIFQKIETDIRSELLQLNILQTNSAKTHITHLLVDLHINGQANISLVQKGTQYMIFKGLEFTGEYQSTTCVNIIQEAQECKLNMTLVNIYPQVFDVGNQSSLIISIMNNTAFLIHKVDIQIGNNDLCKDLSSVSSDYSLQLTFGGIINEQNSSEVTVTQVRAYFNICYSTQYLGYTGLLMGYGLNSTIKMQSLIIQSNLTAHYLNSSGLCGNIDGIVHIDGCSIISAVGGHQVQFFGFIGYSYQQLIFTSINMSFTNKDFNNGYQIGSLIGYNEAKSIFKNIILYNSSFGTADTNGGLAAFSFDTKITNSSVQECNFSTGTGGMVAHSKFVFINSSQVINIKFGNDQPLYTKYSGGIIGLVVNAQIYYSVVSNLQMNTYAEYSAGFVARVYDEFNQYPSHSISIYNCLLQYSSVWSFASYCAGFVSWSDATIILNHSNVSNVQTSSLYSGAFVGIYTNQLTIIFSKAEQIQINGFFAGIISAIYRPGAQVQLSFTDRSNQINGLGISNCVNFTDENDQSGCAQGSVCPQSKFYYSYQQTVVTHNITSTADFQFNGPVNNALVDVEDNAFISGSNLFNSEQLYNVKIQLGAQTISTCSLISMQNLKIVNNLAIISKASKLMTVQQQLNILQNAVNRTTIQNLLINLVFSSDSIGSIDLIGTLVLDKILQIINYQIKGEYYSQKTSCLCINTNENANVYVKQVNFNPITINFGNSSSYLFIFVNNCTLMLQRIVINLGSSTKSNAITAVSSNIFIPFIFGGICTSINASHVDLQFITYDIYISYSTKFINSGQIIGSSNKTNNISVSKMCYQETSQFQASSAVTFGIMREIEGNFSLSNTNITLSVSGDVIINQFGTIAFMTPDCSNASMINLNIQVQQTIKTANLQEQNVSALVGRQMSMNWTVQDTIFSNLILNRGTYIGSMAGQCENSKGFVINVIILNSQLTVSDKVTSTSGGFVGQIESSQIDISHSSINKLLLNSKQVNIVSVGFIFGIFSQCSSINQVNQITIESSNISVNDQTQAVIGSIGVSISSIISIQQVQIQNNNITIKSIKDSAQYLYVGYMFGQIQYNQISLLNNKIINSVMQSSVVSGILMICASIANAQNVNIQFTEITIQNISISVASTQKYGLTGLIICKLNDSSMDLQKVQTNNISIIAIGNESCYSGTLVSFVNMSVLKINSFRGQNVSLDLQITSQNSSIGGILGQSNNSNVTLTDCQLDRFNGKSQGNLQSLVGGFIGGIILTNITASDSFITRSIIYANSTTSDTNIGGIVGVIDKNSIAVFRKCNTSFLDISCNILTNLVCRTTLYVGRSDEQSKIDVKQSSVLDSILTVLSSMQPRVASMFGRIENTVIDASLITVNNITINANGASDNTIGSGVVAVLASSTLTFSYSTITNLRISVSGVSEVGTTGSALCGNQVLSSTLNIMEVIVDKIQITLEAPNNIIGAAIVGYSLSAGNILVLNRLTTKYITITYTLSHRTCTGICGVNIGLITGLSDNLAKNTVTESVSNGLFTVTGETTTTYGPCSEIKYKIDGSSQKFEPKGC